MSLNDAIRLARKALLDNYQIEIMNGRAVPKRWHNTARNVAFADAYNKLAEFHSRAARIDEEAP